MASNRPNLKFSDVSEERGFYRKFVNLPEKPEKTLRIADRGDYYTAIGLDAVFIAENIYHTTSVLKNFTLDPNTAKSLFEPQQYVTISPQVVSNLLNVALLDLGFKIEIYDKLWKLLKNASPGNIEQVSDLMNVVVDTSIIIASIKFQFNSQKGNCVIGAAFIDTTNFKIGLLDIIDNEVYSNLESFLIQLGIRECLVPDLTNNENLSGELKKILSVIDRCGCIGTLVKNSEFSNKDIEGDLGKLVGNEFSMSLPEKYSTLALGSTSALIRYLQLLEEENQIRNYDLVDHSLKEYMKLDASAIKAMNLFTQGPIQPFGPSIPNNSSSSSGGKIVSLFQLLNHCKTNAGTRLLNEWLKQPLTEYKKIIERHNLVEYLIDQLELRQLLQTEYLLGIPDIRRLSKKLSKSGSLEDVLKVYQFSRKIPEVAQGLESFLEDDSPTDEMKSLVKREWLDPLISQVTPLEKFQEMIETTVDMEAYENTNEYMIRVEFNEELANIRVKLDELKSKIREIHLTSAEDLGFDPEKKLKLENHHMHGWCMRLTRNDAKELRKHKKYIELSTVKAGIFFSTRELREIAGETSLLEKEYEKQQSVLVKEICNITLTYAPVLDRLSMILARIDVLCSFAHVSSYAPIPYIKPNMHDMGSEKKTHLINSRHPVVELQDDVTFISNDVELEKGTSEFLIITGPNMGGKSTYIRQIGVITLMAQIGCFVPCDEAEIAIVDAILCRVGAGDSQLKGVSTFMVEMLETASILKNATANSLIIVDELGRGTSTYDGFGLAWSIAEHIASKIGCFALFATHFHELTNLADKLPNVKNMHVVAHIDQEVSYNTNKDDITLLYKVEPGISDQSFGIHVAEVVKFPQKLIKMAKRKASELEQLKEQNDKIKKAKISVDEVNSGNEQLKKILKDWASEVRKQSLNKIENLSEEESQKKIQELLRTITEESAKSDNVFLNYIKEELL